MHLDLLLCDGQERLVVCLGFVQDVLQLVLQVGRNVGNIGNPKAAHLLIPRYCQAELSRHPLEQALPNVRRSICYLQKTYRIRDITLAVNFIADSLLYYVLVYLSTAGQRSQKLTSINQGLNELRQNSN